MINLKNVLTLNAVSSLITGILLAALTDKIAMLFSISNTIPFTSAGIFLIVYALFVVFTANQLKQSLKLVNWVITFDIIWGVKSLIIVFMFHENISIIGTVLILVVTAWVWLMAYLQYKTKADRNLGIV